MLLQTLGRIYLSFEALVRCAKPQINNKLLAESSCIRQDRGFAASLPLEVPFDKAVLHEFSRGSAHKANNDF